MKKILLKTSLAILTVLYAVSCKDDPDPSRSMVTVLSKEFRDGKLELEYQYNSNRQLEKIIGYDVSTGQMEYYMKFEYDTRGYLQNEIGHNADGKATGRTQYQKSSDGKFIGSELMVLTGVDSGTVAVRYTYEYNDQGYISKMTWHDPDTGDEESFMDYSYYTNGNLESYEYYLVGGASPEKAFAVKYSPAGDPLTDDISKRRGYPLNLDLYKLVAEEIHYELFDTWLSSPGEYDELITDRVYDSEGFVTEQTITTKYILPAQPDDVIKMKYEYVGI